MKCLWMGLAACVLAVAVGTGDAVALQGSAPPAVRAAEIPAADLVQAADLAGQLRENQRPLILQVGSHVLFAEDHIAGALYAGPGGKADGLESLRKRVADANKDQTIVVYCGCCPWNKCPNIRPAYEELKRLGFANVKALYLPTDFGTDWVKKGYPVEQGR